MGVNPGEKFAFLVADSAIELNERRSTAGPTFALKPGDRQPGNFGCFFFGNKAIDHFGLLQRPNNYDRNSAYRSKETSLYSISAENASRTSEPSFRRALFLFGWHSNSYLAAN